MTDRIVNTLYRSVASAAAIATLLAVAAPAHAQDLRSRLAGRTVLVTAQGELLDYLPDDARIARDTAGRRVVVDSWGNTIAVAMPAEQYFARLERREWRRDRYRPVEGFPETNPDYYPPAPEDDYRDLSTGSVPEFRDQAPGTVERGGLPGMGAPADGLGEPTYEPLPGTQAEDGDLAALPDLSGQGTGEFVPGPTFEPAIAIGDKSSAEVTALQVFLDREGFSPGVIDGKKGSNVTKAIEAWQKATGETLDPNDTETVLERLRLNGGMPFTTYEITAADAAGPYVASIPEDYAHKAALPALSYTSTTEMLAERFHMDEAYLKEMNPGVDFTIPGTIVKVINVGPARKGSVARIVADKGRKQMLAYDEAGGLIAAYPASIGSADTPSPSGIVSVERIALNPNYTYNPKVNFKQGNNDKVLTLQPGPNGPVGTVWIALSKPTYGIHGTPEPSKIGKTQSHGCIRLTNWDATELAKMVKTGVTVEFVD
ncbi:L,D-transpeptidase [Rhizobium sp. TRM95111]|uniref:L,D-transpeptidase family protein n=1 Tax=Rhizobium alarense TaxID=2846851 RepID=UPI001F1C5E4D|nr:L,D-transpeptidase [Rhizobium alarense]MCF3639342.1 L,D-transpeptidase [Rhizobium alarense]